MIKSKRAVIIILFIIICTTLHATYHKIGHCGGPGWSRDLALVGSTLLVPDSIGIHIIDVSEPDDPIYLSCFPVPENCLEIEVIDDIAYVANVEDGLLILDVSDPQSPQIISSCDTPDGALSIFVSDTLVYVADRNTGLQIVNVSNPQEPDIIGSYQNCHASDVRVYDSLAFIMSYNGAPCVIDVSDPTSPTLVTNISNIPDDMNDLVIINSIAYVARESSFSIYDVSDPTVFDLISSCEPLYSIEVSVTQNTAYLIGGYQGFQVVDVSDIYNPEIIGVLQTPRCARNAYISDNIVYIVDLYTGVEIYDISDPVNHELLGWTDTPHVAMSISISNDIAYVADYDSYIRILDISDPDHPYIINNYGIFYTVVDFLIQGNYGYAITSSRLYIFRLDNLVYPEIISFIDIGNTNNSIDFYDSHVYVSSLFEGLKIVCVENPLNPYLVGECDLPDRTNDLLVYHDIVYMVNRTGLILIDASDRSHPHVIPYVHSNNVNTLYSLTRDGDFLFLAGYHNGLIIEDISDPSNPVFLCKIESHPDSKFITKPVVTDNKLIVEDGAWNEILTYDVSDPGNPFLLATYLGNLSSRDMMLYEDHLITVNGYHGVSILNLDSILSTHENPVVETGIELSSYPNPFNVSTSISFSIPQASQVEVSIYNIKGQKIKTITNEIFQKGIQQVTWNGDDDSGNNVGLGVYFYQLNLNGKTEAVKKCVVLQ